MSNINKAFTWAVNTCKSPSVGYSQVYRRGQTVGGITYYDCSSFISTALTQAGFFKENPWFTTRNMQGFLKSSGFVEMSSSVAWLPGDVLWNYDHTEMCYKGGNAGEGGITMGAHQSGVPLADQVSINTFVTQYTYYDLLYRWGETPVIELEWITGNRYLDEEEMKNNAYVFYSVMFFKGYTLNAICGMLGNMQSESHVNPGVWENLAEGNYEGGFGLVQWTPATNYTDWAKGKGYKIDDGNGQCEWIDTETDKGQWIETSTYNISWDDFKKSTKSPDYLASAFLYNFERPSIEVEADRRKQALEWYEYLKDLSPYKPGGNSNKRHMPLYYYLFP